MSNVMSHLFNTNAIRFCKENNPFWYTSGKIGPYFINTHFVYGNEQDATDLLTYIDEALHNKITLPKKVFDKVFYQYENNETYKDVINTMKSYIEENIDINEVDYISAGERRDWFFSNILAYIFNKPHITIYKDLTTVVSDSKFENSQIVKELKGKKVLHIADLITVASSYIRAWIPAVEKLGASMCYSCVVVDRMQGGKEKIEEKGVKSISLVNVNTELFEKALDMNIINNNQLDMLKGFFDNPDETMREFLVNNPEFIEKALNSDEKTKKKAKLLVDSNLYDL